MGIVLACITDRSALALQAASLLSRSEVAVNIRREVPTAEVHYPVAPFEIILLNHEHEDRDELTALVESAAMWFGQHGARRIWVVHNESIHTNSFVRYQTIADICTRIFTDQYATQLSCVEQLIIHCQHQKDDWLNPVDEYSSVICLRSEAVSYGHISVFNELTAIAQGSIKHVAIRVSHSEDVMTLIRASERARVVSGNTELAMNLASLLRIRGWLTNDHQLNTNPTHRLCPPDALMSEHRIPLIETSAHELINSLISTLEVSVDANATQSRSVLILHQIQLAECLFNFPGFEIFQLGDLDTDGQESVQHCLCGIDAKLFSVEAVIADVFKP